MSVTQHLIFNASITTVGAWFNVSLFDNWSIFFNGIEAGATVTVEVSNMFSPDPTSSDAGVSAALTVVANKAMFYPTGRVAWVRVLKTQGGSPTATKAFLDGLIEA